MVSTEVIVLAVPISARLGRGVVGFRSNQGPNARRRVFASRIRNAQNNPAVDGREPIVNASCAPGFRSIALGAKIEADFSPRAEAFQ